MTPDSRYPYGMQYAQPEGFIASPGASSGFAHRFGGQSWRVVDDTPVFGGPSLILVLDTRDPALRSQIDVPALELPLCSYVRSDVWANPQRFSVDHATHSVQVVERRPTGRTIEGPLPVVLPEHDMKLRPMRADEYPIEEDAYYRCCDSFLGGKAIFRVGGKPLWLQEPEEVRCRCSVEPTFVACMGYENYNGPYEFLPDQPLFLGEGALYFFYCAKCRELAVVSQSS
jgi:hypothetical protein